MSERTTNLTTPAKAWTVRRLATAATQPPTVFLCLLLFGLSYTLVDPTSIRRIVGERTLSRSQVSDARQASASNVGRPMDVTLVVDAGQARLPREDLLLFRDPHGNPVPVQTPDDWSKRRRAIVEGMQSVMGRLPGAEKRCALDMQVVSAVQRPGYLEQLITYQSEPGSRVPAYLLIPDSVRKNSAGKTSAVLCLHPTDNQIGHRVVIDSDARPNRQYASELAERGYVTLAPSYPLLANYQPDLQSLGWQSGTLKAVWDNLRGLDLLESLPFVDARGFGCIGHSLGGHNAVYTAVFDDRIKVIVSSCGLDSYLDYYGGDEARWLPEQGWCQTRYMPRLADYRGRLEQIPFDFHEMIGALAPRHVLISAPLHDGNFQAASVDRIAKAAGAVYTLLGHPDRLRVEHPDCDHDFPIAIRQRAYQLFDQVLQR
ncbi:alpha/beta hydrolase family protein [Stieleria sp.]|uniref:alpha/beta hydrolase family protein n=1 Tax=Stieleria sp. TaxID=2795976 RepID=UPI00356ACD68